MFKTERKKYFIFIVTSAFVLLSQLCFAQDGSYSVSNDVSVCNDPADSVPFSEEAIVEESVPNSVITVESVELTTEDEQEDYYLNVALLEECDPELDPSCLEPALALVPAFILIQLYD